MSTLTITKNDENGLELIRSGLKASIQNYFVMLFFVVWYWILIGDQIEGFNIMGAFIKTIKDEPILAFFLIVPFFVYHKLPFKNNWSFKNNVFKFDIDKSEISEDDLKLSDFEGINEVNIKRIIFNSSTHQYCEYRLALMLTSGGEIFIDQSADEAAINKLASAIASRLNKKIQVVD